MSLRILFPLLLIAPLFADATPPPWREGAPTSINDAYRDPELDVARWTSRFEGESREVYRERLKLVHALDLRPGMTVADIGSGTGLFVAYFSKAVGPRGKVIALDIVPRFVSHIRARADKAGLKNVLARLSEQNDVKLAPRSVDLAFVCNTYHHFEEPGRILATIKAALKPGGRLVLIEYHRREGLSRPFIMKHVRANKETFVAEIVAAGFQRRPSSPTPFFYENYLVEFVRP